MTESFDRILGFILAERSEFSKCKRSNKPIDELIKSIAQVNKISLDSNDGKMLTEISKIAFENSDDKEKFKLKAGEYFKREKEKIGKDIAESVLLKEINVRLCLLTRVAYGNLI
jgi:hypothetical protein